MTYFILILIGIILIETLVIVILSIILSSVLKKQEQKEINEYNSKVIERDKNLNKVKKEHTEINNEIKNSKTFSDYKRLANKLQDNDNKD